MSPILNSTDHNYYMPISPVNTGNSNFLVDDNTSLTPHKNNQINQPIPTNFKYFSPQYKNYYGNEQNNTIPRYPYHKNRALTKKQKPIDGNNYDLVKNGNVSIVKDNCGGVVGGSGQFYTNYSALLAADNDTSPNDDYYDLKQMPVSNKCNESDPMLKNHANNYRICKKNMLMKQGAGCSPSSSMAGATAIFQPNLPNQITSPYMQRKNKRFSNIYEYKFNNYNLNPITEDISPNNDT